MSTIRPFNALRPLPANVELLEHLDQVRPDHHRAVLWVTHAEIAPAQWQQWAERLVVYRPPQDTEAAAAGAGA